MEIGLVLLWLLAYLAFFLAGLPIAAALTPYVEDRGASVALPLALAIVTLTVFWVGHVSYGPLAIAAGILALLVVTVGVGQYVDLDDLDWSLVTETFAVFVVAFLFLVGVRALDPAVVAGGGEKFLDYGLVRSIMRSSSLPPGDFWFAGERVQYYYSGHLLSAALTTLTGTPPQYGYNLALAGFYGTLVTAAYGLSGSVGVASGASRRTAAALGAFFVGFASNLYVVGWLALNAVPRDVVASLAGLYGIPQDQIATEVDKVVGPFSYWDASRVIPGTINEFPLFAWLNGDLHGHMMNMPFILLAATLAFAYYRTPATDRRRRIGLLALLGAVIGLVASISTWSFPVGLGVAWLAVAFADADPLSVFGLTPADRETTPYPVRELRWSGGALLVTGLLAGIAFIVVMPFWLGAVSGRSIAVLPDRSGLVPLLAVHGGFLLVFWPSLARRLRPLLARPFAALVVSAAVVVATWLAGPLALALLAALAVGAWALAETSRTERFDAELLYAAAGVTFVAVVAVTLVVEAALQGFGPVDRVDGLLLGAVAALVGALLAVGVALADDQRSPRTPWVGASVLLALVGVVALRVLVVPFVREWYVAGASCSTVTGEAARTNCEYALAAVEPLAVAFVLPVIAIGWALLRRSPGTVTGAAGRTGPGAGAGASASQGAGPGASASHRRDGDVEGAVDGGLGGLGGRSRGRTVARPRDASPPRATGSTRSGGAGEREPSHARDFGLVLMLAGAGLVVLCEFVYVTNAGVGRFNTVFKLYAQTWVLWGPVAGVSLARFLAGRQSVAVRSPLARARRAAVDLPVSGFAQLFVVAIVFTTGIYGAFAMAEHVQLYQAGYCVHPEEPTLDGLAYVDDCHPEEAAAIEWLDDREGRPVVAARPTHSLYQWGSAPSSLTGLPTLAGWSHEAQYRGDEPWRDRVADADAIYTANATVRVAILQKHDVRYVYWGPLERDEVGYSNETFEWLTGVEAQRHGDVVIYAVDQSELGVRDGYDPDAVAGGESVSERAGTSLREEFCTRPPEERPTWATDLCSDSSENDSSSP